MHLYPLLILPIFLPSTLADISTIIITASAPPPRATSPSYTSTSEFELVILTAHNLYRSQHNASALSWNSTLAAFASNYANGCQFKHSGGPSGENLAAGYANATASVDAWGEERKLYNFIKQGFSKDTGHFTQIVWKETQMVGCGRVDCDGKNGVPGWYVVCEYYPPGNVVGQYLQNVQSQLEEAVKGGGDLVKGGEDLVKGGEDVVKGGEDLVKGGEDVVKGGEDLVKEGGQYIQGGVNDAITARRESWVAVVIGVGMVLMLFN